MEKEELIAQIAQKSAIAENEAAKIFDTFIAAIKEGLKKGEKVTIAGFGTFSLSKRKALTFLNPVTRETHEIPERMQPHFKVNRELENSLTKD